MTPVTLNRYTYANNNPLTYWDPDGKQPIDLRYDSDDCAINYACADQQNPAKTTTRPTTPRTSTDGSDEVAAINAARSTPDIYGIDELGFTQSSLFARSVETSTEGSPNVLRVGSELLTAEHRPHDPSAPLSIRQRIMSVAGWVGVTATTVQVGALTCAAYGLVTAGVASTACGLAYAAAEGVGTASDAVLATDACLVEVRSIECAVGAIALAIPAATNKVVSEFVEGDSILGDVLRGAALSAWDESQQPDTGNWPTPLPTFPMPGS